MPAIIIIQMQASVLKELSRLPAFNAALADHLRSLQRFPLDTLAPQSLRTLLSHLAAAACQTRNLLHYRHLQDRSASEKCYLLAQDIFSKIVKDSPQLIEHVANDFLAHVAQHPSCYVSLSFFLMLARTHRPLLPVDRLRKILQKMVSCFQEAGEVKFLREIAGEQIEWNLPRQNLERYLAGRFKPVRRKQGQGEVSISLTKIPPLILPSVKSINSSRYSAVSREDRQRGLTGLRELASAAGEGFVAVELGCLLAHKRTQQAQQFLDNTDYRNKCLAKVETERALSSRMFLAEEHKSGLEKQLDQTNRRHYRKALTVLVNLIDLLFQPNSPQYNFTVLSPFFIDLLDLCEVGIVQSFFQGEEQPASDYFSSIKLDLKPIGAILSGWSERISFITEKKHLRMLWNRNKKHAAFAFEEGLVERQVADEMLLKDVKLTRVEHLRQVPGGKVKVQEKLGCDLALQEIAQRLCALFSTCDMSNPRFYRYEEHLLGMLANYLRHSFSSTTQYLAIELIFPLLLLVKRQILELSHPWLDAMQEPVASGKRKKGKQGRQEALMVAYPGLLCNFLLVVGSLLSNQKHIEKLLSAVFIKCSPFMELLEKYVQFLFQRGLSRQICRVLRFYRQCLETYNQRKLRNQQSKSIKTLFNHLAGYFYPRSGCLAIKLQEQQELIASGQGLPEQQALMHELLQFVKDVFYYCQDQLAQPLLEEQIASFYLKFAFFNFIKLYSTLTVAELLSLQTQAEPTTKESPHVSRVPPINTVFMIDLLRVLTSIAVNRTNEVARKIKQYRIVEFFVREFELQFEVTENVEKYIRKVAKPREVPPPKKEVVESKKSAKIPSLNLKSEKFRTNKTVEDSSQEERTEAKGKKMKGVPALKLPIRSDRSGDKEKERGALDGLLQQLQKPKKGLELNLQLGKLGFAQEQQGAKSSQRDLIYSSQRKIRKIYSNRVLHCQAILLVLSMLLHKGLLDPQYCDQFPIAHGKVNVLYVLHHHLNEESNKSVVPVLAEAVGRIKPFLAGQRLLKLLCTGFTDLSHYHSWKKISAGAYGVIYGCETNLQSPREVAIKEMSFPKSIYQRSVLHDIFTEITCLQNFRLDQRVTTMYNYGVIAHAYVIVMKKYDCSLRDWVTKHKESLPQKLAIILRIFWQLIQTLLLLHEKSVTHYDLKADNVLLQFNAGEDEPCRIVLGDFGECRIFDFGRDQLDMKSRGTECIKSPEMLTLAIHLKKEADNYDRRKKIGTTRASDIWSLGCLFYQLLTGEYLFHRADWVSFYVQVTSPTEELLDKTSLQRLTPYANYSQLVDFLRTCLVRDPQHRPEIRGVMQKFRDLFGEHKQPPALSKSPLAVQRDLQQLVSKYLQEVTKHDVPALPSTQVSKSKQEKEKQGRVLGVHFPSSVNHARTNKFMRVMEDIFFCESVSLADGAYDKIKELHITHVVTTLTHPLLARFNTLVVEFAECGLAGLAFRLAPRISDFLRQVLLLKGRLLFINDESNYATNLLIYTLSYWFRCSVYETWCLINTQILLFPTFTSDLQSLSTALRILNDVEERVEQLPKLQCICGSVTFILKELTRSKRRNDLNCRCRKKKVGETSSFNAGDCLSTGCQAYLDFVKKRYSISWESIKWSSFHTNSLLTLATLSKGRQVLKTQVLLNSAEPLANMVQMGSSVRGCRVFACRVCEMMMMAVTEHRDEVLLIMNNMLRRIRQGIMIPNAQESFAKKTPALSYYTLTKLHMTRNAEQ